jgi:hypothetical protein
MKFNLIKFILIISGLSLYAHSGRTDSKGGHHDYKNGDYHYHTHGPNYFVVIVAVLVFIFCIYLLRKMNK